MSDVSDVRLRKAELRAQVLARRSALPADQRSAAGTLIRDAVLAEPQVQMAGTIAAYYSIGAEPGTHGLVFALWKRGSYVLLPVLRPDGDLDWASYEGPDSLVAGPRGLRPRRQWCGHCGRSLRLNHPATLIGDRASARSTRRYDNQAPLS